ncbi:hypothetical protein GCM10022220_52130 [Actinocatenispora rupis]|uniref:Uncharacterized protein n=1 Tax=Actinocatenispora rupis TaxID=519421 RepID=A0A8J3NE19_9ACTN|nr:hypothetical protein Aru02nite_45010 [Actinocatenispora rupis]
MVGTDLAGVAGRRRARRTGRPVERRDPAPRPGRAAMMGSDDARSARTSALVAVKAHGTAGTYPIVACGWT